MALLFAFILQFAQVWLPSRSPALADVAWNMAGMMLGIAVGLITAGFIAKRRSANPAALDYSSLVPLSVLVLWLLIVDKVHRRPSTGLDWGMRKAWRDTLDISLTKLAGLWATRARRRAA